MKTSNVVLIIIAVLFLMGGCSIGTSYNSMVNSQEATNSSWADVESNYQRRADLIPNLVSVVQGYAKHESGTLTAVIEARAKATAISIDPSKATPAQLKAFASAQGEISSALGKLMMIKEAYPELKANQNFKDLQSQLEGTENRINVARNRFNDTTKEYNQLIRSFPKNIIANMFGFEKRAYFEADANAKEAPKVKF